MADYFTKFSLVIVLKSEAEQKYALNLAQTARGINQGDEQPTDFPADLVAEIEDWNFETEASSDQISCELWLHSDYGGIDAACLFIQHLLKKFDPKGCVTFEWSHDCTKPRVDAYGGGAAVITADKIKTINTCEWLRANTTDKTLEELAGQSHLFSPHTEQCVRCGKSAADDAVENTPCPVTTQTKGKIK